MLTDISFQKSELYTPAKELTYGKLNCMEE